MSERVDPTPGQAPRADARLLKSAVVLWVLAPLLLFLSSVRPTFTHSDRASRVPQQIGAFRLKVRREITPNIERLLGTRDVAWWEFVDQDDNVIFLTSVFHDSNWKSLHPPHICIRGSGFNISEDADFEVDLGEGRGATIGRLVANVQDRPERLYVSFYAFVGQDFITPSYAGFYLEHAIPALFRQATPGFLVRIEAFVGADGLQATEDRCLDVFRRFLPAAEGLIRPR